MKKVKDGYKKDGFIRNFFTMALHIGLVAVAVLYIMNIKEQTYIFGYRIFKEPPVTNEEQEPIVATITISNGVTPNSLRDSLQSKGLIRKDSKWLFIFQFYCSEYRKELKPGTYELSTAMTVEQMMAVMAGAEVKQ